MEKKKDLRVQKTYSALMAAFEALMAEETFDDITVNELCARALIRRPTFYSHFEDKYGFLRFYLNEIQWQIESEADAATDLPVEHFQRSWRAHRLCRRAPGAHPHGPAQQVAADHF